MPVIRKAYEGDGSRRGSHFKPWLVRWTDAGGRQHERSFRTRAEADDHWSSVNHAKRANPYGDPDAGLITFRDWAAGWLAEHQGSPKSRVNYEMALRLHVNPAIGDMLIRDITSEHVRKLILRTLPGKGYSRSTQSTCLMVIGAALQAAVQAERIPANPARRTVRLARKQAAAEFYPATRNEVEQIADAMPRPDWRLAVLVMYGTGVRVSEALGLQHGDVREGFIRATRQAVSPVATGPLKHRAGGEFRDVPMPAWLAAEIPAGAPGAFLVTDRRAVRFRAAFMQACKSAGVPETFTPHMLRHMWASSMLAAGVPVTDVAGYLGHASVQVTYATYRHYIPGQMGNAAAVLDRLWDAG